MKSAFLIVSAKADECIRAGLPSELSSPQPKMRSLTNAIGHTCLDPLALAVDGRKWFQSSGSSRRDLLRRPDLIHACAKFSVGSPAD